MIRIYEAEGRFTVQINRVFRRLMPISRILTISESLPGEPYFGIEAAKRDSQTYVERNMAEVFRKRCSGSVSWNDDAEYLQSLPPWNVGPADWPSRL